jgi:hypothetical protein
MDRGEILNAINQLIDDLPETPEGKHVKATFAAIGIVIGLEVEEYFLNFVEPFINTCEVLTKEALGGRATE